MLTGLFRAVKSLFTSPLENLPPDAKELLDLHNQERARSGLGPLRANADLMKAAQDHATWMAVNNELNHNEGATGFGRRITLTGYQFWIAGENIAMGQPTPQAVFNSWMASPAHRQNILKNYKDVGIGSASMNGVIYWCVDFASPAQAVFQNFEPGVFLSGPLGPKKQTVGVEHLT